MDIIKRLQLNRNPKDLKSGSIVGAKNIMLDSINSSITNEYGFKEAFDTSNIIGHPELQGYEIKGCISCNEEIVIFLHKNADIENEIEEDSKIVRLSDNGNVTIVESNWIWEGGKVIGTFAYNYKGELILAISEVNIDKDIPLKVWNVDRDEVIDSNINLPKYTCNYNIESKGNLVCGTYTFFIRFKISENQYSTWFELTDEIYILDLISKEKLSHKFKYTNFDIDNTYSIEEATVENFDDLYTNTNLKSKNNIVLNLKVFGNLEYQIGYIIKRDTEVLGRLFNTYTSNNEIQYINISDNTFIEEVNIDDFLESQNNFYNVQNLINYNNRLYISNYKKYKTDDLSNLLDGITCKINAIESDDTFVVYNKVIEPESNFYTSDSQTTSVKGYPIVFKKAFIRENKIFLTNSSSDNPISSVYVENNKYFIVNKESFIYYFLSHFFVDDIRLDFTENDDINDYKNFTPLEDPDDLDTVNYTYGLFISEKNINFIATAVCIWSNNKYNSSLLNVDNYDLYIEDNKLYCKTGSRIIDMSDCNIYVLQSKLDEHDIPVHLHLTYSPYADRRGSWNSGWGMNFTTLMNLSVEVYNDESGDEYVLFNSKYNNNRTLLPGNIYAFYIHFIRKDLSYTDGFKLINESVDDEYYINNAGNNYNFVEESNKLFKIPYIQENVDNILLVPEFTINNTQTFKNKGYIGYFITYENIKDSVDYYIAINQARITNTNLIYNNDFNLYNKLEKINGTDKKEIYSNFIYNKLFKEKYIDLSVDDTLTTEKTYITENTDINYLENYYKTLFRLTNNIFFDIQNVDSKYMHLPGFYNTEKVIDFEQEVIVVAGSETVTNPKGQTLNYYKIKGYFIKNYSRLPLNAYSIKEDFKIDNIVLTYIKQSNDSIRDEKVQNVLLETSKISDFLELKQSYKSNPILSYTNYNENTQDEFNKTIYRSDVVSDESLINGFRHFNVENYKNILENKGNIVNIVGVGLYLLVHTEYSLFVFDRNNQLSDNAQLQIPDVFDIDYKELTPSGEGFGGLKDKEESILTKHGYIWFDRISYSIFIFDGQIKPLSADIHNLLKHYFYVENDYEIRFAEDYYSNRLLITIKNNTNYITLSYSFDTNTFISAHDYTFDKNYKTYNNSYIFSEKYPTKLFVYDKQSTNYKNLDIDRTSLLTKLVDGNKLYSYVDIIFNDKYELPKTLNSISYIISRNNDFSNLTDIIDQYFNTNYETKPHLNKIRLYSGFKLYITTDLVFSGELDIEQGEIINKINSSAYSNKPHWRNGIWDFNEFRENLSKAVTINELIQQGLAKQEGGEIKTHQIVDVYDKKRAIYQNGYDKADMRSVISGKYFIFRFVFERNLEDLNLKFETLDVNISKL